VALEPEHDLYGNTLFQGRRFQRLRRFHRAAARDVDAELAAEPVTWFASFLGPDLLLGDPGVRDALMHGNQVCVPDATLLPAGVQRIYPAGTRMADAGTLRYCATERHRDGDSYIYDIALRDATGAVIERWEGLRLQAVRRKDGRGPWVAQLLGPYVERTVGDLVDARVAVAVEPDSAKQDAVPADHVASRRACSTLAASRALDRAVQIRYRPDGRPEVDGDTSVSTAHGAGLTLAVAAGSTVACDVEQVVSRPHASWQGLLGPHTDLAGLVREATGEGRDAAATRVWSAIECLQKAGRSPRGPLTLHSAPRVGWVVFSCGNLHIASLVALVRGRTDPVAIAVLAEGCR
jgi:enediyne polyketide synthase